MTIFRRPTTLDSFGLLCLGVIVALLTSCAPSVQYDIVLRHGTIYDGSGSGPVVGDLAIDGDTIVAIGDLGGAEGTTEIDVQGLAVAPGFINMLSWAGVSLIEDGHSQSDIRQGVTLEVMGEGNSMGPLNPAMKEEAIKRQGDIKFDDRVDLVRRVPSVPREPRGFNQRGVLRRRRDPAGVCHRL